MLDMIEKLKAQIQDTEFNVTTKMSLRYGNIEKDLRDVQGQVTKQNERAKKRKRKLIQAQNEQIEGTKREILSIFFTENQQNIVQNRDIEGVKTLFKEQHEKEKAELERVIQMAMQVKEAFEKVDVTEYVKGKFQDEIVFIKEQLNYLQGTKSDRLDMQRKPCSLSPSLSLPTRL